MRLEYQILLKFPP